MFGPEKDVSVLKCRFNFRSECPEMNSIVSRRLVYDCLCQSGYFTSLYSASSLEYHAAVNMDTTLRHSEPTSPCFTPLMLSTKQGNNKYVFWYATTGDEPDLPLSGSTL
jgi:hypothetical protein